MSVIQKIRDRYARIAVIAIALALLGFILMDAFAGRGSLLGGRDTVLGKINGKKIDAQEFTGRVNKIVKQQGQNSDVATQQIVEQLWQSELNDQIMGEQYKALGLTVGDKELDQLMFSATPSQAVLQAFGVQDPKQWNPSVVRQRILQINKSGTADEREGLKQATNFIVQQTLLEKYNALLQNSTYVPKWLLEKRNVDNALMAKAAYVTVPYTSIADSTVKVTDAEINDYVKAHKKDFEVKDESRTISYVQFSAAPSSKDTAAVRDGLAALRDSFQRTKDAKEFLLQNRSDFQYNDSWIAAKDVRLQNGDTIFKAPVGIVSGPYVELGRLVLAKIIDKKQQPDTAKVRHILIQTAQQNPQTGEFMPTRDTVAAKKTADSVMAAIAAGTLFDSLMKKLSDDPSKATNNGVFDSITRDARLVPEFKDFALNNPVGSKKVVRTAFGYHYMEVLNQRGNSEVYKLALFSRPVDPSTETTTAAQEAANKLAGNATDEKSFKDYFDKNLKGKGIAASDAPLTATLHPMDYNLPGEQIQVRGFVKDVFESSKGKVLDPKSIGSNFIVAVVTDVIEPGSPSASSVRPMVESQLLNKKKAQKIKEQMGKVSDLNAVATKFNQQVQNLDSIRFSGAGPLGFEAKVIGALFNPDNKGKTVADPIAGTGGVYAIRVDNTFTGAVENAAIDQQRQMLEMQSRQQMQSPLQLLQKRATIKDNRAKFY